MKIDQVSETAFKINNTYGILQDDNSENWFVVDYSNAIYGPAKFNECLVYVMWLLPNLSAISKNADDLYSVNGNYAIGKTNGRWIVLTKGETGTTQIFGSDEFEKCLDHIMEKIG